MKIVKKQSEPMEAFVLFGDSFYNGCMPQWFHDFLAYHNEHSTLNIRGKFEFGTNNIEIEIEIIGRDRLLGRLLHCYTSGDIIVKCPTVIHGCPCDAIPISPDTLRNDYVIVEQ